MSRTLVAAASCTGASRDAEPLGAQPHLVERFLARDIGGTPPACPMPRRAPQRPAAAGSICRCRDRRRPAAPSPAPGRRRRPGRTRRCRSAGAAAAGVARSARRKSRRAAALAPPRPLGGAARAAASSTRCSRRRRRRSGRPICGGRRRIPGRRSGCLGARHRSAQDSSEARLTARAPPSGSGLRRGRG